MAKKVTTVKVATEGEAKIFKFESENKFLFVGDVGVQFNDGKAEVADEEVAERLRKAYGVKEV